MRFAATRSVLRKAVIWGLVGLGVAIFFLLASTFTHALSSLQLIFWPTSLAFMALDNATTTRTEWVEGAAFLAFTNFALYFLVGANFDLFVEGWKPTGFKGGLCSLAGAESGMTPKPATPTKSAAV